MSERAPAGNDSKKKGRFCAVCNNDTMKSEVIIQKSHRNPFDHQLRTTGIKLVVIETRDELRNAINDKTAMMHFSNFANAAGQIKVDEWIKLGKEYKIPCMKRHAGKKIVDP